MIKYTNKQKSKLPYKVLSALIAFTFTFTMILPPEYVRAQMMPTVLNLPVPGTMVPTTPSYIPTMIKGITIHPENPLLFDFVVDSGHSDLVGEELNDEATKLVKYFLATLTVPDEDLWVNLSPNEPDRIIANGLGDTEMGRDMLAQDYLLKQLTATLMYPEKELGKTFWDKIYRQANEKFNTSEIPVDTFNKVWIVPQKAVVLEKDNSAYVIGSRLKVLLENDYVSMRESAQLSGVSDHNEGNNDLTNNTTGHRSLSTKIINEIIIPAIEEEVNTGKNFAPLRQIYNSMILATWYKQNLKQSLLGQIYFDQNKTQGVDTEDKQITQKIYDQYLTSFKKGVYNYIKEDIDQSTGEMIPRKYFSGGEELINIGAILKSVLDSEVSASPLSMQRAVRSLNPVGNGKDFTFLIVEETDSVRQVLEKGESVVQAVSPIKNFLLVLGLLSVMQASPNVEAAIFNGVDELIDPIVQMVEKNGSDFVSVSVAGSNNGDLAVSSGNGQSNQNKKVLSKFIKPFLIGAFVLGIVSIMIAQKSKRDKIVIDIEKDIFDFLKNEENWNSLKKINEKQLRIIAGILRSLIEKEPDEQKREPFRILHHALAPLTEKKGFDLSSIQSSTLPEKQQIQQLHKILKKYTSKKASSPISKRDILTGVQRFENEAMIPPYEVRFYNLQIFVDEIISDVFRFVDTNPKDSGDIIRQLEETLQNIPSVGGREYIKSRIKETLKQLMEGLEAYQQAEYLEGENSNAAERRVSSTIAAKILFLVETIKGLHFYVSDDLDNKSAIVLHEKLENYVYILSEILGAILDNEDLDEIIEKSNDLQKDVQTLIDNDEGREAYRSIPLLKVFKYIAKDVVRKINLIEDELFENIDETNVESTASSSVKIEDMVAFSTQAQLIIRSADYLVQILRNVKNAVEIIERWGDLTNQGAFKDKKVMGIDLENMTVQIESAMYSLGYNVHAAKIRGESQELKTLLIAAVMKHMRELYDGKKKVTPARSSLTGSSSPVEVNEAFRKVKEGLLSTSNQSYGHFSDFIISDVLLDGEEAQVGYSRYNENSVFKYLIAYFDELKNEFVMGSGEVKVKDGKKIVTTNSEQVELYRVAVSDITDDGIEEAILDFVTSSPIAVTSEIRMNEKVMSEVHPVVEVVDFGEMMGMSSVTVEYINDSGVEERANLLQAKVTPKLSGKVPLEEIGRYLYFKNNYTSRYLSQLIFNQRPLKYIKHNLSVKSNRTAYQFYFEEGKEIWIDTGTASEKRDAANLPIREVIKRLQQERVLNGYKVLNSGKTLNGSLYLLVQMKKSLKEEKDSNQKPVQQIKTSSPVAPGGIDFNPALLDLQIKRDGNGIPLPLPMQPIESMHIEGFVPIIINVVPINNLPLLLGLTLPQDQENDLSYDLDPLDNRKARFEYSA